MKLTVLIILLFLSVPFLCNSQNTYEKEQEISVKIHLNQTAQTIEGWGSSLCWWAGQVGNWKESRVDSLIELITSPNGLNMNIFRYNIGGGDDPSHIDGHMVKGKGKRAEMEGFKASADAPYNWKADKAQRIIMLKIKEKRPDAVFEAFSNSPPYWMTISGCSAGNIEPKKDNLKPEYYEAFCDYLIDVCKFYKSEYGIEFKTLEPFNESTSAYWNYLGSQEGCHFDPETQMKIIRLLYPKLKASGLNTVLSASDETNIKSTIKVIEAYQQAGDILDKIGQINTHTYSGSSEERKEAFNLVSATGKEFWQSETGPMGLPRKAQGLENNLLLTQKMFDDLNIMQAQAWLDWQLMEENNDVWGLIKCNFKTEDYEIVKNLYVRMQITRFIKQGYTIVETDNEKVLAAINPEKTELVVAMNNPSETQRSFSLNFNSFSKKIKRAEIYRTSKNEDCKKLPTLKVKNQALSFSAPALSLTTMVFKLQ
jgi:O-glycosyl hydrolase